ncbi:MAG: hypothetical protein KatS3mg065_0667 [Chloroflexota bacterium]|nr:MAG: hypothetical protein KatS3mg065_0667 [Chloroflexota bacterium]
MPRSAVDGIEGVVEGALRVRVTAAPTGGAANEALLRLLAAELGLPRRAVRLVAGATGRRKLVAVEGIRPEELAARFPGLAL